MGRSPDGLRGFLLAGELGDAFVGQHFRDGMIEHLGELPVHQIQRKRVHMGDVVLNIGDHNPVIGGVKNVDNLILFECRHAEPGG